MYQIVREITQGTYEIFDEFEDFEEARRYQKFLEAFLGYEIKILEVQNV